MRTLICGIILLFSVLVAIYALDCQENDLNNNFDSDMFWIGSNMQSTGRPKFKITQHPDGYSMQLGFSGYYMRIRYTESDHSIDYNIVDYKGSVKYRVNDFRPDGSDFEAEADVYHDVQENSNSGGCRSSGGCGLPMDAKVKLKYSRVKDGQFRSPLDPHDIEVSITNNFKDGGRHRNYMYLPATEMKNTKHMEAVFKISINPKTWAESTVNFNLNLKGDLYNYVSGNDWNDNWFPGTYKLSASLMIINVVEPTRSQRQPKMTAALDLEEEITYDEGAGDVPNVPRDQNLLKKSILLDGMINLTGKGARLGVLKATDADTSKSIGRIQARRVDEENLRLELFADGKQQGALNLYESSSGMTNVTIEDSTDCDEYPDFLYGYPEDEYYGNFSNGTNFDSPENDTITNAASSENCHKNRFFESLVGDGIYETRLYKDVFYIGAPPSYKKSYTEGDNGLWMEQKMFAKNGNYEDSLSFSDLRDRDINTLYSKLNNEGQDTNIQLGVIKQYRHWRTDVLTTNTDENINVEIKPSTTEESEFNFKLSYKNDRIFDGWFYLTRLIRRYAREHMPALLERQLADFTAGHDEILRVLLKYV